MAGPPLTTLTRAGAADRLLVAAAMRGGAARRARPSGMGRRFTSGC